MAACSKPAHAHLLMVGATTCVCSPCRLLFLTHIHNDSSMNGELLGKLWSLMARTPGGPSCLQAQHPFGLCTQLAAHRGLLGLHGAKPQAGSARGTSTQPAQHATWVGAWGVASCSAVHLCTVVVSQHAVHQAGSVCCMQHWYTDGVSAAAVAETCMCNHAASITPALCYLAP